VLNLYKAYADVLTKDHLDGIHRQLWTDLTSLLKLDNFMVVIHVYLFLNSYYLISKLFNAFSI